MTLSIYFLAQALDAKVIIFKKKRRKNYRRTKGHRQVTEMRLIANRFPIGSHFPQFLL